MVGEVRIELTSSRSQGECLKPLGYSPTYGGLWDARIPVSTFSESRYAISANSPNL